MSGPGYEFFVLRLASICPAARLAVYLEASFSPLLRSAMTYLPPGLYSRFATSLLLYPVIGEVLALFLPAPQGLFIFASMALVQSAPFLIPFAFSHARRRSIEAELPFFLVFLSILSRDSTPSIEDGLGRIAALGDSVFPAFSLEAGILERDMSFAPGTPAEVVEKMFDSHPSKRLRQFIRGLMTTLTTGRSAAEFVEEEAVRQVELMEARWRTFSESIGSLAEVSLMVLALFPVGLEMMAAAIPGVAAAEILALSLLILAVFTGALLLLMDSVQPAAYNERPDVYPVALTISTWGITTSLYFLGVLSIEASLLVSLVVSAYGVLCTKGIYGRIREGEEEVGALLHHLAEASKAGMSLPEALSEAVSETKMYSSIGQPLAAFEQSIMLGSSPEQAQKSVSHPSWLVRLSFGMLSVVFVTGAGYEKLERLSSFFKRLSDARRNATRSLLPFFIVGVIVPGISLTAVSFLSSFGQGGVPFFPSFTEVSKEYILLSISAVSLMSGLLLSKLYTQSTRHAIAVPVLLASTFVSLIVLGLL